MLLLGPVLAAIVAGLLAGGISLPFLRSRSSGVVLVAVTAMYFPLWIWWLYGLHIDVYPMLPLRGLLPMVGPPAGWALMSGAWIAVRLRRDARGQATSSGVYIHRLLQFAGVAILAVIVLGIEGMRRAINAHHGVIQASPHVFLLISSVILLAFVVFVCVRERDPEIALLLIVLSIGAVVPIVGLGRLAATA